MTATAIFSKTIFSKITDKTISNAVQSYRGSKIFIQKLIPTTLGIILFHRTDINRNNFEEHNFKGLKFMTFKRVLTDKVLKEVCRWCNGALDAFNKEYLKELHLLFLDITNKCEVVESYTFGFEYNNCKNRKGTISNEIVKTAMIEIITSISEIEVEPLKEKNVIPYICIDYTNDVPVTYKPPHFKSAPPENRMAKYLKLKCKRYIKCGKIMTGFHSMTYRWNIPRWRPYLNNKPKDKASTRDIENLEGLNGYNEHGSILNDDAIVNTSLNISDNEEVMETNEEINHKKSYKADDNVSICPSQSNSSTSTTEKISCLCSLKKKFYNIELVQCSLCDSVQHLPCTGRLYRTELNGPYACHNCENHSRELNSRIVSSLRLSAAFCFFNSDFPTEVFNEMKFNVKSFLITIFQMYKIADYVDDKCVIQEGMDQFLKWLFNENNKDILKELNIRKQSLK